MNAQAALPSPGSCPASPPSLLGGTAILHYVQNAPKKSRPRRACSVERMIPSPSTRNPNHRFHRASSAGERQTRRPPHSAQSPLPPSELGGELQNEKISPLSAQSPLPPSKLGGELQSVITARYVPFIWSHPCRRRQTARTTGMTERRRDKATIPLDLNAASVHPIVTIPLALAIARRATPPRLASRPSHSSHPSVGQPAVRRTDSVSNPPSVDAQRPAPSGIPSRRGFAPRADRPPSATPSLPPTTGHIYGFHHSRDRSPPRPSHLG